MVLSKSVVRSLGPKKKNSSLVVVASKSIAHLMTGRVLPSKINDLKLIQTFEHPEGRLRIRELGAGPPGRVYARAPGSHMAHSVSRQKDEYEMHVDRFVKKLASYIDKYVDEHHGTEMVLVSEARLLGKIRKSLSTESQRRVQKEIRSDLAKLPVTQLIRRLSST